jgi:hypothetical protein
MQPLLISKAGKDFLDQRIKKVLVWVWGSSTHPTQAMIFDSEIAFRFEEKE